jgi:MYND finger
MVICVTCDEEIPKAKRCAHGKKPTNCGGVCLTAYVEEHMATCEGKNGTGDKRRAKVSQDKAKVAQAAKDDKDNNEDAIDLVAEGADVGAKGLTVRRMTKLTCSRQEATSSHSISSGHTIQADPDADLAQLYSDDAQGILDMIKNLRHMPELMSCRNCNKRKQEVGPIRKCTGCGLVGYCGKECQREHWDAVHKEECKILRGVAGLEVSKDEVQERLRELEG